MYQPYNTIKDGAVALDMLKKGNKRFVSNQLAEKNNYAQERNALADEQCPFAVILTCADSRVAPEIFFDQALGDLFVLRNAGNVATISALGAIEFAVEFLKAPLVVVVGHSMCAAVIAAHQNAVLHGNMKTVLDQLKLGCAGSADTDEAIHNNAKYTAELIRNNEIIKHCKATVVSAHYDIQSGIVSWL
jgi:carbonic anhydrase